MSTVDLKAYTKRAAELETAIYTQKQLMKDHSAAIRNQRPKEPKKPDIKMPIRPIEPPKEVSTAPVFGAMGLILGIPIAIGCIVFISAAPVFGLVMTALCLYGVFNIASSGNQEKEKRNQERIQYDVDLVKYNRDMDEYKRDMQRAQNNYNTDMAEYKTATREYDSESSVIFQKHAKTLSALEAALKELYSDDVVYPKYRDMIAMSTISEYLASGRCYELEGPDGAYNLYEMELRQNIIIDQMSNIISNLEQIRRNQYALYQELRKSNETINGILREVRGVRENTRLTAYFAGVTALIEASPKVYIGHTF